MTETQNEQTKPSEKIRPEQEALLVAWVALLLGAFATAYCFRRGLLLLYGDAVSHLFIARRIFDSSEPGLRQIGTVWLPLPHLLFAPFTAISDWWQNGVAGAWINVPSYALACAALYRLARLWLAPAFALIAVLFFGLNPGLLYMSSTAMTEPLFLAEMVWAVLLLVLYQRAVARESRADDSADRGSERKAPLPRRSARLLAWLTAVLVAAVFTRYDGWILGTVVWIVVTIPEISAWRKRKPRTAWIAFTVVLAAAPALWLLYNAEVFKDPLSFLRGPYSAKAIEARSSPPGAPPHPGTGNLRVSALYYLKSAEMGAVPLPAGDAYLLLAIAGTIAALFRFRQKFAWPLLLFWLPVPFYSYAVAYGSIPIFIPPWPPHSWYNTRYGMEMLPGFALFGAFLADGAFRASRLLRKRRNLRSAHVPRVETGAFILLLLLIGLNCYLLLAPGPLVFREAWANSRTRIPFDRAVSDALLTLPPHGHILVDASRMAGALQLAGIPLRRTVNEADWKTWQRALNDPAQSAPAIVALDGGPIAHAIERHPEGLDLIQIVCSTGQPCARIYHSTAFLPAAPGGSIDTGGDG